MNFKEGTRIALESCHGVSFTLTETSGGYVRELLVFNAESNLDFQDIRANVIRIPEVAARLRETQEIWDAKSSVALDVSNFTGAEDAVFLANIRLKNFVTAVVQVGLLDRYLKKHLMPQFLLGSINGDSPVKVATGRLTFSEMVSRSSALIGPQSARGSLTSLSGFTAVAEAPVLAGIQLAEYGAFQASAEGGYQPLPLDPTEIDTLVLKVVEGFQVGKVVVIGPGHSLGGKASLDMADRDVQLLDSIDLDPMLSWFWARSSENRPTATAN